MPKIARRLLREIKQRFIQSYTQNSKILHDVIHDYKIKKIKSHEMLQ